MKRSLFLKVFMGHILVILIVAAAVALFLPRTMRSVYIQAETAHLDHTGTAMTARLLEIMAGGDRRELEAYVTSLRRETGIRFTVIDAEGNVLADSEKEPSDMENHLYRPEIFAALQGEKKASVRRSATLQAEMMYMSLPLREGGKITGVLRLSMFMKNIEVMYARLRTGLLRVLVLAVVLAGLAALYFSGGLAGPIGEVIDASSRVAGGDLKAKVSVRRSGILGTLAGSFNKMTGDLSASFEAESALKRELQEIISAVKEGICILDRSGRVSRANAAFTAMVGEEKTEGRLYIEVIRSSGFAEVFKKALDSGRAASAEVEIGGRAYLCSLSPLAQAGKFLAVFYDLTELRNVERLKKDFVVNCSHELKTPLAAVKGFVETMEPSIDEANRPYLDVIKRNVDRMLAIVDDLLYLSSLETRRPALRTEEVDLAALARSVLEVFKKTASEKGLTMTLEAPEPPLRLKADPFQLEKVLVNLLDNAVKYTEKGGVTLRLGRRDGRLMIEVEDTGIGIDAEHLPRVFERFYVVDKSRSRKYGGTGLGLSIVKHVVELHKGTIDIKSSPGRGTTVTLLLPLES
jgi:two-component system phosphate regulon sensor histidine kinase PhoR